MAGLQEITSFQISRAALDYSYEFMKSVGRRGYEGLVFWAGVLHGDLAHVSEAYVPAQKAYRTPDGLLVHVESEALHHFNSELYRRSLRFLAQIHSHGEHAYHSETDDNHSMVTTLGGLSLVVPHFANTPFDLGTCAVYRLTHEGWMEVSLKDKYELIQVVG